MKLMWYIQYANNTFFNISWFLDTNVLHTEGQITRTDILNMWIHIKVEVVTEPDSAIVQSSRCWLQVTLGAAIQ